MLKKLGKLDNFEYFLGLFSKAREIKDQEDGHKPQMDKRIDSKVTEIPIFNF